MKISDPNRPKMPNGEPAFFNHRRIGSLETFPLDEETCRVSLWCPMQDTGYSMIRMSFEASLLDLPSLLIEFYADPEAFVEARFQDKSGIPIDVRNRRMQKMEDFLDEEKPQAVKVIKKGKSPQLSSSEKSKLLEMADFDS